MVRFKLILEVIEKEKLLQNAHIMGGKLLNGLQDLAEEFPALVTNPRGTGLFAAFDLPSQFERDNLINLLSKNNLLILPSGDVSIRFRPHLNVLEEDLDLALDIIKTSIQTTLN